VGQVFVPIFPLPDLTFFPHTLLPLHVFEARYRAMVTDCLARDKRMAVVALEPGYEPAYDGKPAVRRIAAQFRESDYQVKVALRQLLHSEAFWAPESRGALVKSPVELVVGTLRQFDVGYTDPLPFVLLLRNLGQDLFSPPNVRGWPGGEAWIDTRTLLARKAFLERLMRVDEMRLAPMPAMAEKPMARRAQQAMLELRFSADDWLRGFRGREQAVQTVLLALAPAADVSTASGADRVRALTADPVYQLK